MKKIGIVICNYNKREYVVNCIQSVLESKTDDFDIYVVDNASTDDSVEAIRSKYGDQVTVLVNSENLGGSGGFNTGIRKVLEEGYEYLYCLDNDVLVDENAVGALADYLDAHEDTGVAGSIVYHMDYPDYVQQYGLDIDFENYTAITHYADFLDDGSIPEVNFCDTVATCSVMIRTDCIKTTDIGIMPENNFIYWDDMEWIYRFTLAGFKVVTIKNSVVLHKMGSNTRPANTFINYYMWRNRINFFMKYTPETKLDTMSYRILSAVFDSLYESMYREEHHVMQTISYAFYDAVRGVRGKAAEHKILENDANDDKFRAYVKDKKSFYLTPCGNAEQQEMTENFIKALAPHLKQCEEAGEADFTVCLCDYVMHVKDGDHSVVYIDTENNCILDEDDWMAVANYAYAKSLFIYMNQAPFLDAVSDRRKK
ncbi:MAG: glycosyltransferase family 2 protein [Roseburia sp.]|nr:glycosyltransferase family 2 protein [Roseburia sp.]